EDGGLRRALPGAQSRDSGLPDLRGRHGERSGGLDGRDRQEADQRWTCGNQPPEERSGATGFDLDRSGCYTRSASSAEISLDDGLNAQRPPPSLLRKQEAFFVWARTPRPGSEHRRPAGNWWIGTAVCYPAPGPTYA